MFKVRIHMLKLREDRLVTGVMQTRNTLRGIRRIDFSFLFREKKKESRNSRCPDF